MNRLIKLSLVVSLLVMTGCPDDGPTESADVSADVVNVPDTTTPDVEADVPSDPKEDTGPDPVPDVTLVPDVPEDVPAPPDDTPDVIVNPPPTETTMQFWLIGADDAVYGLDEDTVVIYPEDEPAAYAVEDYPGLQMDIYAEAVGVQTGAEMRFYLKTALMEDETLVATQDWTSSTTFNRVTLPASTEGYEISVEVDGVDGPVTMSKTLTVLTGACEIAIAPVNDVCLTDPDGGAFDLPVTVSLSSGDCDQATLTYQLGDDAEAVTTDAVAFDAAGETTFTVPVAADGAAFEGSVYIVATALHPSSPALTGVSQTIYTVDNGVPEMAFTSPDGVDLTTLTLQNDGESDAGLQFDVVGSSLGLTTTDLNSVTLTIGETMYGTTTPSANGFTFPDVTFTQDGPVTLTVSGIDGCGNEGSATVNVEVYSTRPNLLIATPNDEAILLAKGDGDDATSDIYETTFEIIATDLADGTPLEVRCEASGGVAEPVTVANFVADQATLDLAVLPVALNTNQFGQAMTCAIHSLGPNLATSNSITLYVALPAPTLTIDTPADNAKLTSMTLDVAGQATHLDGQELELEMYSSGVSVCSVAGGTVDSDIVTGTFDLGAVCPDLADGLYSIRFDAEDALGNRISELTDQPQVLISFDTVAPGLSRVLPADLVLDPVSNPDHADSAPAPGYQSSFSFQFEDEANVAGGEICLSVNGAPEDPPADATLGTQGEGCQVVDASGVATWTAVTLQPNDNTYVAWAYDAYGNPSAQYTDTVTLNFVGLNVAITEPDPTAGAIFVADSNIDITVAVSDSESDAPIEGAAVSLEVNNTPLALAPSSSGGGSYTFTAVPLSGGGAQDQVVATASYLGLDGASSTLTVTYKTSTPAVTLDAIPATLNLASTECVGATADCTLTATATATNVAAGNAAGLAVDCGAGATNYDATVELDGTTINFPGTVLTHGATCTLVATVTDSAGQDGASEQLEATVDRVAPVLASFNSPSEVLGAAGVLESLTVAGGDDKSADEGLQHDLVVVADGLETGTVVSAQLDWIDADTGTPMSRTLESTLTETIAEGSGATVSFSDGEDGYVDWPTGDVTVTIMAADLAGNPAISLVATTLVQPFAPSVRIQVPATAGGSCTTSDECVSGTCGQNLCWRSWNIQESKQILFSVSGLSTTTDNFRVCSNAAGLSATGTPCASPGATGGEGGPYYQLGDLQSATDGGATVVFSSDQLQKGYQTVIAEIQPDSGGPWVSSWLQDVPDQASRRLYIDLDTPVLEDPDGDEGPKLPVDCESDTELPLMRLSYVEQEIPDGDQEDGGTFKFKVYASEDGTATVYVNGEPVDTVEIESQVAAFQLLLLDEGVSTIGVQIEDLAGNLSVPVTDPAALTSQFVIDTVKPLIEWTAPLVETLTSNDSLDVKVTCTDGCEDGGTVTLSSDLKGIIGQAPMVAGTAIFADGDFSALEEGTNILSATATDTSFNQGLVITQSVFVDTVAPTASFSTLAGYEVDDLPELMDGQNDDADAGTNAFDLAVAFAVSNGATSWSLDLASCTDGTYASCSASSQVASGDVADDGSVSQTIGVPIVETPAHRLLTLTVMDAVANAQVVTQGFSVEVTGCLVGLTNIIAGDYYSIATGCPGATPCTDASLALNADYLACGDVTQVRLFNDTTLLAVDDELDGTADFNITVNDGDVIDFMVKVYSGNDVDGFVEQGASSLQTRTFDFTVPTLSLTETTVAAFDTPADQGTVIYGIASDLNPVTTALFEGHIAVQIDDANLAGGSVVSLTGTVGEAVSAITPSNTTSMSNAFGSASELRTFEDLAYADQVATTVTVTVADAAGNEASSFFVANVDLIIPATPTLAEIADADVEPRLPAITLNWSAIDEDGADGGAASTYDIRYSKLPITTTEEFEDACQVSALAHADELPVPGTPDAAESYTVKGPDPSTIGTCKLASSLPDEGVAAPTYYFAVRAADAAGNWSDFSTAETAAMAYSAFRVDATSLGDGFLTLYSDSVGDISGDTVGDLIFGFTYSERVCVIYGGDDLSGYALENEEGAFTDNGTNHACVTSTTLNVTGAGGIGGWVESVGDVNGDGLHDLGVSGKIDGAKGFVAIFLGKAGGPDLTEPDVVITGVDAAVGFPYGSFCGAGNFTGAVSGANPIDSIGVAETLTSVMNVVPGNAAWTAGMGAAGAPVYIDLDTPANLTTHNVLSITATFGDNYGLYCHRAGDVLPTPGGGETVCEDLMIQQNWGGENRVFIHPGRVLSAGASTAAISEDPLSAADCPEGTDCAEDLLAVRLFQDTGVGTKAGFGKMLTGGADLSGDGVPDPVIGHPYRTPEVGDGRSVWIFDGAKLAEAAGQQAHRVVSSATKTGNSWNGNNGWVVEASCDDLYGNISLIGDFDGWQSNGAPTVDLAVANKTFSAVNVFGNHSDEAKGYDLGLFPHIDATVGNPGHPGAGFAAASVSGGHDLTGDDRPDIVIGGGVGEMVIVH